MNNRERITRIEKFLDSRFAGALSIFPYHRIDCTCESDPLGRCVVHSKPTREEQIEAAAEVLVNGPAASIFRHAIKNLREALALPKILRHCSGFKLSNLGVRIADCSLAEGHNGQHTSQDGHHTWYASGYQPAQPTEAEMRRTVMEAGWTQGRCGGWWAQEDRAFVKTLPEAYARVMREKGATHGNS